MRDWYLQKGYAVLAANWRCADGELDLVFITQDSSTFVFCEVKTRSSLGLGSGLESVNGAKQRRVRRLAARWLAEYRSSAPRRVPNREIRFDAAYVLWDRTGNVEVEVLEGAF